MTGHVTPGGLHVEVSGGPVVSRGLAVVSLRLRVGDMEGAIAPWGLVLSVVIAALLTITGWLGGELSYRHLVGVNPKRTTRSDVRHE
ncbi:MAG: DUF2231 domain-containing protein [Actinobacteria bacterium]|nr:DUF2231 domain-containing protein [Actinomycetota bacterium]